VVRAGYVDSIMPGGLDLRQEDRITGRRFFAAARSARESMELQDGGAALEWVLTALALDRLGRTEEARPWLARAVAWAERNRPGDPFLRGLRSEAAGVLGLPITGEEKTTNLELGRRSQVDRGFSSRNPSVRG
jgi:hypothetical protein